MAGEVFQLTKGLPCVDKDLTSIHRADIMKQN